jgi:hypothetical protein
VFLPESHHVQVGKVGRQEEFNHWSFQFCTCRCLLLKSRHWGVCCLSHDCQVYTAYVTNFRCLLLRSRLSGVYCLSHDFQVSTAFGHSGVHCLSRLSGVYCSSHDFQVSTAYVTTFRCLLLWLVLCTEPTFPESRWRQWQTPQSSVTFSCRHLVGRR